MRDNSGREPREDVFARDAGGPSDYSLSTLASKQLPRAPFLRDRSAGEARGTAQEPWAAGV